MKKLAVCLVLLFALVCAGYSIELKDLMNEIKGHQDKIKDMYVEMTTTMSSQLNLGASAPQKMVNKSRMWTKGQGKVKTEMLSPMRQITIVNGNKIAMINPQTGQKTVNDINKQQQDMRQFNDPSKALDYFNLSVKDEKDKYIITGTPKQANQLFSKMVFEIDKKNKVTKKVMLYNNKGDVISVSELEYKEVSSILVPYKTRSIINTPQGMMNVDVVYDAIKLNSGISDNEFKI